MLSLQDVLSLSPNASEEELRAKGLLPQPAPPPAPSMLGVPTAGATAPVAKMTPPVLQHPNVPTPVPSPNPTPPQVAPMTPPANADLGIKPMVPPAGAPTGSVASDQAELDNMKYKDTHPWGTPGNHDNFLGKLGHIAAKVGNIALDVAAPRTAALIPGTEMHNSIAEKNLERKLAGAKQEEAAESQAKANTDIRDREATTAEESEKNKAPLYDAEATKNLAESIAALNPQAKTDFEAWQKQNPNKPVEEWLKALGANKPPSAEQDTARATQIRADMAAQKPVSDADKNWLKGHTQEKTLVPATNFNLNQGNKNDARSDKSYQYSTTAIDKVGTPVDQLTQRMGRLNDTLAQNTPQADALVAPELLSVMAGGQGSGLRMNEAEIARIVGGRSKWEDLKAAINQWSLDPTKANSITDEQRKEIRDLTATVQSKLTQKQKILDDARNGLLDTDDPKEHRKIVAETKSKLDKIDAGEEEKKESTEAAKAPEGKVPVYAPDGAQHFVLKDKKDAMLKDPKYKGWTDKAPETKSAPAKQ